MPIYQKGNIGLIQPGVICLFSSREIPLSLYNPVLDFLNLIMQQQLTLAGGWHSRIEKRALQQRGVKAKSNIIFCLAKGIDYFRLTENLESDFKNGKILILSHWQDEKRIDQHKSDLRNKYMLETFNKFLFLSIKNTGNLEKLFYDCMSKNKQVFLFDHFSNIPWSENGAELVSAGNWSMLK